MRIKCQRSLADNSYGQNQPLKLHQREGMALSRAASEYASQYAALVAGALSRTARGATLFSGDVVQRTGVPSLWKDVLVLARCALILSFGAFASSAVAAELEPRYVYRSTAGSTQHFDTADQAFEAYKTWEDNNNLTRPNSHKITVLGYEAVGSPGQNYVLFNGLPNGYQFRFRRPFDCPDSCLGNGIVMNPECPVGTSAASTTLGTGSYRFYCVDSKREPDLNDCPVGNPIYPSTGLKREVAIDYDGGAGNLQFKRIYRSDRNGWQNNYQTAAVEVDSAIGTPSSPTGACRAGVGQLSSQSYCFRYISVGQSNTFIVERSDGRVLRFNSVTGLPLSSDVNDRVTRLTDSNGVLIGWEVYDSSDDSTNRFDISGRLQAISLRGGQSRTLLYSDTSTPSTVAPYSGLLIRVTDENGNQLNFSYDGQGRMLTMTDPAGGLYTYAYDEPSSVVLVGQLAVGNLTSVTYPDLTKLTYWYNEQDKTSNANLHFALTGINDESGNRYSSYAYDSSGRGISTEHAGGRQRYTFTYANGQTIVNEPLGAARTFGYTSILDVDKVTSISGLCTSGCSMNAASAFDANGNVTSRTDFKGYKACYTNDLARNLETIRVEGFASGLSCPTNLATYTPAAGTRQRKITTQWHPTYRLPTQIDEPGKRTTYTHDANGNVLTRTELDTATSTSRTWAYSYNSFGKVLTANGPRMDVSDVTTYKYYSCTTGFHCGQVHTITNAAGHVTTYNTYNAHGQPLTITDPNGVATTLTYDLRQRLTSRTVGTEATTLEYWPTGLLKKATLPDASYLAYTYDAAHRLTEIQDSEGNRIVYTLDAMGNRTKEDLRDLSNALSQTRTRVFDTLNRLQKEIGAAGTANVTTTYGYDNNGNQTSVATPLNRNSSRTYDELNRLTQDTDPLTGITRYGYNALDQLISVTDPKSLVTSYSYNALGDLQQQTSPDTGVMTNTYDSGGNLSTSTDPRNAVSTYTYDSLNRVASAAFTMGSTTDPTIAYTYDAGTYGKGKLTGASDSNHSLSWTYDDQGRLLTAGQAVGTVSKTTSYAYSNGQRQSMTTPSGQLIAYGYTHGKVTSISVNGTVLVSNVLYESFGPARQWTWGNGTLSVRTFDQDGKITQIDSAGLKTYSYDDAFRITGITDTTNSALSWTYGYDDLDRLTSGSKTGTSLGYSYDANGNRLTQTGSSASTFTVAANSNRLTSIAGALARTYGYDNAGNTTSFTGISFTYNNRSRMKSSTKNGVTTDYTYNALGQLIKKGSNALYYYDDAGHILGIYNGSGALTEEIVWLGDIPIVTLRPKVGGGINIYHIHTDHLNTPRLVTGSVNPGVRWRLDAEPFGGGTVNNNPAGAGVFEFNLRFAGQVYLAETGLNYNYFRDYDPATGRYVQSDPIGLEGGINTYAYVKSNPLSFADPSGLDSRAEPSPCIWCWPFAPPTERPPGGWLEDEWLQDLLRPIMEAAPGNVADTQIKEDYEKYASAERLCGKTPKDRCTWLDENKSRYRADQVKATQKAWGCRRSRALR